MLRTYFLDKSGMITGWGFPPTWRENTSSCPSSGSTGSGDQTPTSRMPSKSPSKQWRSRTTMFGSIGRKKSFTWWSKFSFSHLVPMREMWLILRLTLLLSCSMKFSMYPFDEQHCHMSMESCKWRLVRFISSANTQHCPPVGSVSHHGWPHLWVVSSGADPPGGGAHTAAPAGANLQHHGWLHLCIFNRWKIHNFSFLNLPK